MGLPKTLGQNGQPACQAGEGNDAERPTEVDVDLDSTRRRSTSVGVRSVGSSFIVLNRLWGISQEMVSIIRIIGRTTLEVVHPVTRCRKACCWCRGRAQSATMSLVLIREII